MSSADRAEVVDGTDGAGQAVAADVAAALAGLGAALVVERLPRNTRAGQRAAAAVVDRRVVDAVDAGATVD